MEKIRDNKLAENVTAQGFADRVNLFNTKINPFLEDPFTGTKLSSFILEFLPDALSTDKRALLRELEREGHLDDPEIYPRSSLRDATSWSRMRTWRPKTSRRLACWLLRWPLVHRPGGCRSCSQRRLSGCSGDKFL